MNYDGHTLEPVLDQHEQLTGKRTKSENVDRGYQSRSRIGETEIAIPNSTKKS